MRFASKQSRYQQVLTMVHPAVARLARNVASRETPRTSMVDLAMRIATILQKAIDTSGTPPDTLVSSVRNKIIEIADWAAATGNEWKALPSLDEMALAARNWHDELAMRVDDKAQYATEDQVVMDFPDGWKIVELHPDNCGVEGKIMGHCVGGYSDYVKKGLDRIFSLRDPNNRPHVTFNATQRATGEDVETWDDDNEWDSSKEQAYVQRGEDWRALVGPEARRNLQMDAMDRIRANNPESLFSQENVEIEAAKLAKDMIQKAKRKYERRWGKVTELDVAPVWSSRESKYGDESHIEDWANKDYDTRKADYSDPLDSWHIDQIQGKEDSAPLDKYRPYIHQFLTDLDLNTSDVDERMLPVDRMIEHLEQSPRRFQHYLQGLRDVDQTRLYDFMVTKHLAADPDDDNYSDDWKLAEYVKRRIEMGSATPEQQALAVKLFEVGEARVIIGTSLYEVIRGGSEWVAKKLLGEKNPDRFAWYINMLIPRKFFNDPGLRMATIRKAELMFDDAKAHDEDVPSNLLSNYLTLLGKDGTRERMDKIVEMQNYQHERQVLRQHYGIGGLERDTEETLADLYEEDPERWKQLVGAMSPDLRQFTLQESHKNLVLPAGRTLGRDKQLPLEGVPTLPPLGAEIPSWSNMGNENMRSNIAIQDVHERERRRREPGQMQMFASITRLAQKLEEVSPLMADRLEALL